MSTDDAERLTARPTVHDTYGGARPSPRHRSRRYCSGSCPSPGPCAGTPATDCGSMRPPASPSPHSRSRRAWPTQSSPACPSRRGCTPLLLPVLVYAGLGATRRGVIGPEGAVALLVATALAPLAVAGSPEYTALAAALAIAVGCVFVLARLLHLGWLADYFSQSVLVGYISGVADPDGSRPAVEAHRRLQRRRGRDPGGRRHPRPPRRRQPVDRGRRRCSRLAILVALQRLAPRWPGALIVVVLGMFASWALDLGPAASTLTGPVPAGLA